MGELTRIYTVPFGAVDNAAAALVEQQHFDRVVSGETAGTGVLINDAVATEVLTAVFRYNDPTAPDPDAPGTTPPGSLQWIGIWMKLLRPIRNPPRPPPPPRPPMLPIRPGPDRRRYLAEVVALNSAIPEVPPPAPAPPPSLVACVDSCHLTTLSRLRAPVLQRSAVHRGGR